MFLIGRENPITGREGKTLRDRVDPVGGAFGENKLFRLASEEDGRVRADVIHRMFLRAVSVPHGIELELVPGRDGALQHRTRCRSERAGLQIGETRCEHEITRHIREPALPRRKRRIEEAKKQAEEMLVQSNILLEQRVTERTRELSKILDVSQTIGSTLQLDRLLQNDGIGLARPDYDIVTTGGGLAFKLASLPTICIK